MKIVINSCYGGFEVSKGFFYYHYGIPCEVPCDDRVRRDIERWRTDKRLIEFIEKFGSEAASGYHSYLTIEEISAGTKYWIENYDGLEIIHTGDRLKGK